ncbi:MAG: type II toxin-antitoxin system RelE/ParE family toxin [Xanthobacteraceae bacterium]
MTRIVYHRNALKDLEAIRSYIARDNPDAANHVVARIRQATERLKSFPFSGRSGPGGVRLLSVSGLPYIVIRRIRDDTIRIVAVFHTSRNRRF